MEEDDTNCGLRSESRAAPATYDDAFFDSHIDGMLCSARAVVPTALRLIPAKSVVDFGCGRGAWLKAFLENRVETVLGLDGHYVNRDKLLIDPQQFRAADLQKPIHLDQRFDLALCLEVGEHLPARSSRGLVRSLAAAAPVVLFSAALPGQGGTSHINEQWPLYWERLFAERGMRKYDVVRPVIWSNEAIEWYYRQNLYLFTSSCVPALESMEQFERGFFLVSEVVMSKLTFRWSTRALNYTAVVQKIHSAISRFT